MKKIQSVRDSFYIINYMLLVETSIYNGGKWFCSFRKYVKYLGETLYYCKVNAIINFTKGIDLVDLI